MADSERKSRAQKNDDKRMNFFKELTPVYFDFHSEVNFKNFKNGMSESLAKLSEVCSKEAKGSATKKYLRLIKEASDSLLGLLQAIEIDKVIELSSKLHGDWISLQKILLQTSKARFPSLINQSRLDFPSTREKFKKLSEDLERSMKLFYALVNENNCSIFINKWKKLSLDNLPKGKPLTLNETIKIYKSPTGDTLAHYDLKYVTTSRIYSVRYLLKEDFNTVRDFSRQIEELSKICNDLKEWDKGRNYADDAVDDEKCVGCNKTKRCYRGLCPNNKHALCLDCLIHITGKRFSSFECPKCKQPLRKDLVLDYIRLET